MHAFIEAHPEFSGFSAHYNQHILPKLEAADDVRKAALSKVRLACFGIAIAALICGFIWNTYVQDNLRQTVFITLAFAGFGMVMAAQRILKGIKSETKSHLAGGICNFIGWTFSERVTIDPQIDVWTTNGLIHKKYDRVKLEDQMYGEAHGTLFWAMEAHIQREVRSGKNKTLETTFQGSLFSIAFKRKFLGRTVVRRNNALYNKKEFEGMKKVGLVDPTFEKIFQAYGTDQVEARYLLTPDFMQQLVDLETSVNGKRIRFGFIDNALLIAVETADRFEAGSMLKPLTSPDRAQKILDEIGAVYDVIDGVLKSKRAD